MKKTLSKKEIEEYKEFRQKKMRGQILTADTVRFICEACNYNAEDIGKYFLDMLPHLTKKK